MQKNRLIIPPKPSILLEIQGLMQQEEMDLVKISGLIKTDVALYSILLSIVNSPWMGLRQEVTNVETAISLMGIERLVNLLQSVIIRSCFKDAPLLNTFWDTASEVAGISQVLAEKYTTLKADDAYSAGILHNAGVPIMLMNFDNYDRFLFKHVRRSANELCVLERRTFQTDHYLQGALMAKAWYMGNVVSLAIRYQPIAASILNNEKDLPADICALVAVLTLAKDISNEYRHYWQVEATDFDFKCIDAALKHLNISEAEYAALKDDTISEFIEDEVA